MGDTNSIVKFVAFVALIATFAIAVTWWEPSAPTVSGWANLQDALDDDPFVDFPSFTPPPSGNNTVTCDWWDILCFVATGLAWIGATLFYFGEVIYWFFLTIYNILAWLVNVTVNLFGALFGAATLTFTGMPAAVQIFMWVIIAPLLILVIFVIIRFFRGQ